MKETNRNYIAVGTFVLAMLVALIGWFAILSGTTSSTDAYHIQWDNVMGLKPGTQILFEGYQIGLIDEIQRSTGNGKNFRVNIEVTRGWPMPDSAIAETTSPTFLAAMVVNIRSGDSATILEPGSEIASKEPDDLLSAAGDVLSTVTDTLEFIKPELEKITSSVGSVLSEENARQIAEMLETLTTRVQEILSADNTARIENILANLHDVSVDVSDMTTGLRTTKSQVDAVLDKVNGLIDSHSGDIGHSLVDLHASLETVSRHIDAISNNLEGATRNFDEFSSQIRANPGVLLRGREAVDDEAAAE